jgi:hypothetical protein
MRKLFTATAGTLLLALGVSGVASADFSGAVTSKPTKLTKRDARLISLGCYRGAHADAPMLPFFGLGPAGALDAGLRFGEYDPEEANDDTWTCPDFANMKFQYLYLYDQGAENFLRVRLRQRTEGCKTINKTTVDCTIRYETRLKPPGQKEQRRSCTVVKRVVLSPASGDEYVIPVAARPRGLDAGGFTIRIVDVTSKGDCRSLGFPGKRPVIIEEPPVEGDPGNSAIIVD